MVPKGHDTELKKLSKGFDHLELEESDTAVTELSDSLTSSNGENSSRSMGGTSEMCNNGTTEANKEDIPPQISLETGVVDNRHLIRRPSILKKPQEEQDSLNSQNGKTKPKQSVSFDRITVREYSMTLGDNPSCSYGPPVQLDWDYDENDSRDVDEFEDARSKERCGNLRFLCINYWDRCKIIQAAGHGERDIKNAERKVNRTRRQRDTTRFFLPVMKVEHVVKSAGRKIKRVVKPEKGTLDNISETCPTALKQ
jgi:hypothetical protein|eukprot:CAMPEP_0195287634 /NCGR_PEP_ID=MMETSP0707-20130614/4609_1 /TAXON_ID=33640 /ORGANISM="Asterionellopsis glacialis, Strain CCMP134" /LENGTH=253 /DNA_ID=CAMNT_0040347405 /DNA_START=195 /DNA_END=956 /DNA_ORIENTATION=+